MYCAAHVSITCKNVEESYSFYHNTLGFEALESIETDELKIINVDAKGLVIELLERKNNFNDRSQAGPVDHIAFYAENFDYEYSRLQSMGVRMLLKAPKYFKDKKLMFVEGPNGERIEIMEK